MLARDLMTGAPKAVTIHETATHAARLMAQFDIGFLPIVDDQAHRRLIGVITLGDLVRLAGRSHPVLIEQLEEKIHSRGMLVP